MKFVKLLIIIAIIVVTYVTVVPSLPKSFHNPFTTLPSPIPTQIPMPTPISPKLFLSVFIPYWNIPETEEIALPPIKSIQSIKPRLIYFGITANTQGLNTYEQGFTTLTKSTLAFDGLTLRLLDSDLNLKILDTPLLQEKIIHQTIDTVLDHNIKEIVLDFELTALPLSDLEKQISDFISLFSKTAHSQNLRFSMTLYGDHFYRHRPFDLNALNPLIDQFYIMNYDLHKAGGDPGPNFPLTGKEDYGTDLEESIPQFLSFIKAKKITMVYGLYGYDWIVDENKHPFQKAKSLPLTDIRKSFIDSCAWKNCIVRRDEKSHETEINYIDKSLLYHVIWFEDEASVEDKITFAKTKGIVNSAIWIYGYY